MKSLRAPFAKMSRKAFTLMEVLISMAILSLLFMMTATIVSMTNQTWTLGRHRMDNTSNARLIFDMMTDDLSRAVLMKNLLAFPVNGNALTFISNVEVPGADRRVALLQYAWSDSDKSSDLGLYRYAAAFGYGGSSKGERVPFTTSKSGPSIPMETVPSLIGPGVVAFEFRYVAANGNLGKTFIMADTSQFNPSATMAIEVSLATLDEENLKILQTGTQLKDFLSEFSQVSDTDSPVYVWNHLKLSAFPRTVREATRIYGRTISLPYPWH